MTHSGEQPHDPQPHDPQPHGQSEADGRREPTAPRPILERLGLALIAAVLALMFAGVAVAAWSGGEPFLAVMGGIGSLMTVWVATVTVIRG